MIVSVVTIAAVALGMLVFHQSLSSAADGSFPAAQTAPKDGIVLPAKMGNVTYNHSKHSATACDKCHHKPQGDNKNPKCSVCHTETSTVKAKDAFHKRCIDCHKEVVAKDAASKAPTKCNECHKK
jgi:hypothetical protein